MRKSLNVASIIHFHAINLTPKDYVLVRISGIKLLWSIVTIITTGTYPYESTSHLLGHAVDESRMVILQAIVCAQISYQLGTCPVGSNDTLGDWTRKTKPAWLEWAGMDGCVSGERIGNQGDEFMQ
jgi:hypothetical protein